MSRQQASQTVMEYLIRQADGDWFNLHKSYFAEVLRPSSFPSRPIAGKGDYRIDVCGCQISFSCEDPGIQVSIDSGGLTREEASLVVTEIADNITKATEQKSQVVPLSLGIQ